MMERYEFVKKYIFDGFVTVQVEIGDLDFVCKSICAEEYEYLKKFKISILSKYEKAYNLQFSLYYFLFSIYSINGYNVLKDRAYCIDSLYSVVKKLPFNIISKVVSELNRYFDASFSHANDSLESFLYEAESSTRWKVFKNNNKSFERMNMISGSDKLPLNFFQSQWVIFNNYEESYHEQEKLYSLAKFMTSVHSPKGVRKLDAQDEIRKREERERRDYIREKGSPGHIPRLVEPPFTAEELINQLDNSVTGNYDEHDKIMMKLEEKSLNGYINNNLKYKVLRKQKINDINAEYKDKLEKVTTAEEYSQLTASRNEKIKNIPVISLDSDPGYRNLVDSQAIWNVKSTNKKVSEESKKLHRVAENFEDSPKEIGSDIPKEGNLENHKLGDLPFDEKMNDLLDFENVNKLKGKDFSEELLKQYNKKSLSDSKYF